MKKLILIILSFICINGFIIQARIPVNRNLPTKYDQNFKTIDKRVRVIIDNDFGGDPDGLFQLVHHILSPTVDICGIIGSHHYPNGFYGLPGDAGFACNRVNELLNTMKLRNKFQVYRGADFSLSDEHVAVETDGVRAIIKEAMRSDTSLPLYVVCGASLTDLASAFLLEPEIENRIILIWIGGPEYNGLGIAPPGTPQLEYNLGIDIKAAKVVFNTSTIPVWQIPRNVYRQALYSYAELINGVKSHGKTGRFLMDKLDDLMNRANHSLGEAYVLGDSPLVLFTALQSSWECDPSSSKYVNLPSPIINDSGLYEDNPNGRKIRVYTDIDSRLILDDFVAKLILFNK